MTIRPFDAVNYLRSDAEMAAYLATVMEDEDPVLLAAAIEDIARAKGLIAAMLSQGAMIAGESQLLPKETNSVDSLLQVIQALDLKLSVSMRTEPKHAAP